MSEVDLLQRCMNLVRECPLDEDTADIMYTLANQLYAVGHITIDQFAEALRIYADWLQDNTTATLKHGV